MALLLFDSPASAASSPVGHLLEVAQRQRTAAELNAAILAGQQQDTGENTRLLRTCLWGLCRASGCGNAEGQGTRVLLFCSIL